MLDHIFICGTTLLSLIYDHVRPCHNYTSPNEHGKILQILIKYDTRYYLFAIHYDGQVMLPEIYPSKHGAFAQCCINVGPASKTVDQH